MTDVFEATPVTPEAAPQAEAPQAEANDAGLFTVGDRTYTKEDAVTKISNQDEHINRLQTENEQFRQQMDDLHEKVMQLSRAPAEPGSAPAAPADQAEPPVREVIQAELAAARAAEVAARNAQSVNSALLERFGSADAAKAAVQQKATELNLPLEQLKVMAENSPAAVLAWFPGSPATPQPTQASTNPQAMAAANAQSAAKAGTYRWWNDYRKSDPKAYFSQKVTKQRMEDANRLGDAFFT